jgi:hypothetical protein
VLNVTDWIKGQGVLLVVGGVEGDISRELRSTWKEAVAINRNFQTRELWTSRSKFNAESFSEVKNLQ